MIDLYMSLIIGHNVSDTYLEIGVHSLGQILRGSGGAVGSLKQASTWFL